MRSYSSQTISQEVLDAAFFNQREQTEQAKQTDVCRDDGRHVRKVSWCEGFHCLKFCPRHLLRDETII
jgi:hypothetical protein